LNKALQVPSFGSKDVITASPRQLEPHALGKDLVMSFARMHFKWSKHHIPGSEIATWEVVGDADGDKAMAQTKVTNHSSAGFDEFLSKLKDTSGIESVPEWMDEELLQVGCDFFVATWPLAFLCFSWALLGGFGAETASAVLVESRYWALKGETGQRDSFQRLQETAAWLYDMCAHGAHSFRPGGIAWEAALHVRFLHARTRAAVSSKKSWDTGKNGLPINQAQLIGTLLGLSVLVLQGMEKTMGCQFQSQHREGFIHLWRVIGYLFGIEEALNPNTSFSNACINMESVFAFAIPSHPDPAITGKLSKHMCETISRGMSEQYGVHVPAAHFAARTRLYLGDPYCDAIGLPQVEWRYRLLSWFFTRCMKIMYLPYIWLPFPVVARIYDKIMRAWFSKVVRVLRWKHSQQGKSCRFGSLAPPGSHLCPMKSPSTAMAA
jgi:hypothetical protein